MAGFKYRMQPLLNLKRQMEDNKKIEMGNAVKKLEEEKDLLNGLYSEMEESISEAGIESSMGTSIGKLKEYSSYISFLKTKVEIQKENVKFVQENVDNIREQLVKFSQEKKMLEKLREKRYEIFLTEQNKIEEKLVDEVVSYNSTGRTGERHQS